MEWYYSTYFSGVSSVVEKILSKDLPDVKIQEVNDGIIEYRTNQKMESVKRIKYFNNSFLALYKKKMSIPKMIAFLINDQEFSQRVRKLNLKRNAGFRIVVSDQNELVKVENKMLGRLESKIQKTLNIRVNRSKPYYQFWIYARSEGYVYFSLRITTLQKKDKERPRGELRPQLAHLMTLLSEPKDNELFLDPFCGSGAIPLARVSLSRKGLVMASDIDRDKVSDLREKVQKEKLKNRVVVRCLNALELDRYEDGSIHKIVTDPPWGEFERMENIDEFYDQMLDELSRILVSQGLLVLLTGRESAFDFEKAGKNKNLNILFRYNILVSGRKAVILVYRKEDEQN